MDLERIPLFRRRKDFYVNARAVIERDGPREREVLLQRRVKPGQPRRLEFPGGQLDPFEGITDALAREVREETGLTVSGYLTDLRGTVTVTPAAEVECLTPSFVYQTRRGPVDSVGFFFRVQASGDLTERGDGAAGHEWVPLGEVRRRFRDAPDTFDWLTQAALRHLLTHDWAGHTGPDDSREGVLEPGTVLLVRHARATGQEPGALLTPDGEGAAQALASSLCGLGVTRIVSSPWERAAATARPLADRLGLPVTLDQRLTERVLSGAPRADWRERLRASFADDRLCLPGGESGAAARARIQSALADARDPAGVTVVVTHGNLLALALCLGFEDWAALRNPDVWTLHTGAARRWPA
ncbi:histidine phosphatase family protein [Deinococcus sp. ME38]|uniref:histidine phosphatase family protein n=1 Tax=Deinococcus sp. ME38 TaxID=3400344 RepID=UPI003B5B0D3E